MLAYSLVRPALFALDAENAHRLTFEALHVLERCGLASLARQAVPDDPCQAMGLALRNPIGLAAGLDKDGRHIDALAGLGFGFLEIGTVTPRAQPGNPRPRMFRLPEAQALINRMGFNNDGVDAFVRNVQRSRYWQSGGVLGLNIGKNADTPIDRAVDDYLFCMERVYRYASYIAVNISSPNTRNLRQLQGADALDALLAALLDRKQRLADAHKRDVPLALKIAPDLDDAQIDAIADAALRHRLDALIATNTTLSREAVQGLRHANEFGGLSGAPVAGATNRVIAALRKRVGDEIAIIGVGGVMSGADARAKIDAGAQLVQLYTGLIYAGPSLVGECAAALRPAPR